MQIHLSKIVQIFFVKNYPNNLFEIENTWCPPKIFISFFFGNISIPSSPNSNGKVKKTVLTCDLWPSRSWVDWGVIFCFHIKMKIFPVLAVMITCLDFWNSIWHHAILNNEYFFTKNIWIIFDKNICTIFDKNICTIFDKNIWNIFLDKFWQKIFGSFLQKCFWQKYLHNIWQKYLNNCTIFKENICNFF